MKHYEAIFFKVSKWFKSVFILLIFFRFVFIYLSEKNFLNFLQNTKPYYEKKKKKKERKERKKRIMLYEIDMLQKYLFSWSFQFSALLFLKKVKRKESHKILLSTKATPMNKPFVFRWKIRCSWREKHFIFKRDTESSQARNFKSCLKNKSLEWFIIVSGGGYKSSFKIHKVPDRYFKYYHSVLWKCSSQQRLFVRMMLWRVYMFLKEKSLY